MLSPVILCDSPWNSPGRLRSRLVYAIIEDSGSQIKVQTGDVVELDLRPMDDGATEVVFDRVLAIGDDSTDESAKIGAPYIEGATVKGELIAETKGEKLHIIKYKRRKGYRRKVGHRQKYLSIRIESIDG